MVFGVSRDRVVVMGRERVSAPGVASMWIVMRISV